MLVVAAHDKPVVILVLDTAYETEHGYQRGPLYDLLASYGVVLPQQACIPAQFLLHDRP